MDASVNRKLRRKGHETEGKDTHESENSYKRPGGEDTQVSEFSREKKGQPRIRIFLQLSGHFSD